MNTIDVVEYFPTLYRENPLAIPVYSTLKHFCNKQGQCDITLSDVAENLSIDPIGMRSVCEILVRHGLLIKQPTGFLINMQPKRLKHSSKLENYAFGDTIPNGYEALIDEKQMYRCFTTNGLALWSILAEVCRFLNLDYFVAKRLLENDNFKQKFIAIRKKVEQAAEISGMKVTKRVLKKGSDKTITELYDQLINEVHLKNEHEIPRHEWKTPQLLRWYCLEYKKRYNEQVVFTRSPFGGPEMKALKQVYEAFDQKGDQAADYIDWCFSTKSNDPGLKYPIVPNFIAHDRVIKEYKTRDATTFHNKPKQTNSADLPTSFIGWVVENHPKVQETYHLSKQQDVVWLKKALTEEQVKDPDVVAVVEHAITIGLLHG